ncbi:hypothetical protein D3C87_2100270 [compost metagenome]
MNPASASAFDWSLESLPSPRTTMAHSPSDSAKLAAMTSKFPCFRFTQVVAVSSIIIQAVPAME